MAQCLLEELPATVFQAVLDHVAREDHLNLRLVSRSISQLTTRCQLPYITMLLTDTSNWSWIQQWFQATKQLRHVSNCHVYIAGEVLEKLFDWAMQLLAKRHNIKVLHLLPAADDVRNDGWYGISRQDGGYEARLSTLYPVRHLLSAGLQTLVISSMAVKDLAADMNQLAAASAAAGRWQLQSLTLGAAQYYNIASTRLNWRQFAIAQWNLFSTLPKLKHVHLHLPRLKFPDSQTPAGDSAATAAAANDAAADCRDDIMPLLIQASTVTVEHDPMQGSHQPAKLAVIASLVNAALQLRSLNALTVTNVPDIWEDSKIVAMPAALPTQSMGRTAAVPDTTRHPGLLLSLSEAAAALKTLDGCGCWLMQHHPTLRQLHIQCGTQDDDRDCSWGISWQQQQQQELYRHGNSRVNGISAHGGSSPVPPPAVTDVMISCSDMDLVQENPVFDNWFTQEDVDAADADSSCMEWEFQGSSFQALVSRYSPRSGAMLFNCWQHISSCQLVVYWYHRHLANFFRSLVALKHLEMDLSYQESLTPANSEFARAISAAAVLPNLQSLRVRSHAAIMPLQGHQLLPLTAAAAGPGSNLTKLELIGALVSRSDEESTVEDETTQTTAMRTMAADDAVATAVGLGLRRGPQCALQQLVGLHELTLCFDSYTVLNMMAIEVDHLPMGLKVLTCCGINIISAVAGAAQPTHDAGTAIGNQPVAGAACAAGSSVAVSSGNSTRQQRVTVSRPQLQRLNLTGCKLESPNILASTQLQHLTVIDSTWPGGWRTAAAAWPAVTRLTWKYDEGFEHVTAPSSPAQSNNSSSGAGSSSHSSGDIDATTWEGVNHCVNTLNTFCVEHMSRLFADSQELVGSSYSSSGRISHQHVTEGGLATEYPVESVLLDILSGFDHLKSLTVLSWPLVQLISLVSEEVLQPVLQQHKALQQLHLQVKP